MAIVDESNFYLKLKLNVTNEPDYDYMKLWWFERDFDVEYWKHWFATWGTVSIPIAGLYILLVFTGQGWMKGRKPYRLRGPLAIWNIGLAIMSILITVRMAPEFHANLKSPTWFYNMICMWDWRTEHSSATAFWVTLMVFSKALELGDTAFVVLRKQKLLFLHWFHHAVTLSSWWVMYPSYEPVMGYYALMNAFVHSFMYSYYALKALNFKLPRNLSMFITTIQLLQMVVGVIFSCYSGWLMTIYGLESCPHRTWFSLKLTFAIYLSYLYLFGKLFYDYYIVPKRTVGMKKVE